VIAKPILKTFNQAPRQTYLYEAGRQSRFASRLEMSRPQLKKATHFYSFLLIFTHSYPFLLIFVTAIFRHVKPPSFQKNLSFLIMAYYFLSKLIIRSIYFKEEF